MEEQGGRLIELSQQVRDLDRKVDRLSDRFDTKFDALDLKFGAKFDSLQSEMTKQFRWTIGVMLTLAGLVVALVSSASRSIATHRCPPC